MNRLCFAFVVTTATCAAAHAQDLSKIPPPHMPVVSVPTDAKWVLALSKDSDNSSTTSTGAASEPERSSSDSSRASPPGRAAAGRRAPCTRPA